MSGYQKKNPPPEAHLHLAYGLEKNGQIQDAERELLAAIRLRPNYLKGYRWLTEFHKRQGKYQDAHASYQKLLELDASQAKDPDLLFNLAFSHQKLGDRTEADPLLQGTPPGRPNTRPGKL
ncbi:tetratricopeptide repeat protein [candidate division KSB1 bacterium]|nr:tetratricopeptide repeat protein [candidate division KSB1 bacterium]